VQHYFSSGLNSHTAIYKGVSASNNLLTGNLFELVKSAETFPLVWDLTADLTLTRLFIFQGELTAMSESAPTLASIRRAVCATASVRFSSELIVNCKRQLAHPQESDLAVKKPLGCPRSFKLI
jgi:hypothetical protein